MDDSLDSAPHGWQVQPYSTPLPWDRPLTARTVSHLEISNLKFLEAETLVATMARPNPFLLAADNSSTLLPLLRSNPDLAAGQDVHGYSLLHAAASYNHLSLLRTLVNEFHVDVNIADEDGDTCLYVAETIDIAKCLVEELKIDTNKRNDEGLKAVDAIEQDGSFPDVAEYLRRIEDNGALDSHANNSNGEATGRLPPLPPNVTVDIGTMADQFTNGEAQEPDPEFKRRIDELAAKENFNTDEGQRELRDLITDAVRGVSGEQRDVRRRLD